MAGQRGVPACRLPGGPSASAPLECVQQGRFSGLHSSVAVWWAAAGASPARLRPRIVFSASYKRGKQRKLVSWAKSSAPMMRWPTVPTAEPMAPAGGNPLAITVLKQDPGCHGSRASGLWAPSQQRSASSSAQLQAFALQGNSGEPWTPDRGKQAAQQAARQQSYGTSQSGRAGGTRQHDIADERLRGRVRAPRDRPVGWAAAAACRRHSYPLRPLHPTLSPSSPSINQPVQLRCQFRGCRAGGPAS